MRKSLSLIFAVLLAVPFSCSQEDALEKTDNEPAIPLNANKAYQVIKESGSTDSKVVYYASLSKDSGTQLPSYIYLNGTALFDNGSNFDRVANDGVYSSKELAVSGITNEKAGRVFVTDLSNREIRSNISGRTEACTAGFYGDGAMTPCGRCPASSILGFDTWFCICIDDCSW